MPCSPKTFFYRWLMAFFVGLSALSARGYDWSTAATISTGVKHASVVGYEGSRTLKINCLQIDASTPGIRVYTTPRCDGWVENSKETLRQSTASFIASTHGTSSTSKNVAAAINANFYGTNGSYADVYHLAVSDGVKVSPAGTAYAFLQNKQGAVCIAAEPSDYSNVLGAVSTYYYSLLNDVPQTPSSTAGDPLNVNPRTGIGTSQDNRYVYFMTIDGRNAGGSGGATVYEEGEWLRSFGAYTGINMDGGGSTTMAWWNTDLGEAELLNVPSDGSARLVANNIGVYYVPEPSCSVLLVVACMGWMAYAWRRRR